MKKGSSRLKRICFDRSTIFVVQIPFARCCDYSTGQRKAIAVEIVSSSRPNNVQELRPKTGDTEKVTINPGFVQMEGST